jgi:Rap1a immunity proteins
MSNTFPCKPLGRSNWSAHSDKQQQIAAARHLLRAGGLQRKGSPNTPTSAVTGSTVTLLGDRMLRILMTFLALALCPHYSQASGFDGSYFLRTCSASVKHSEGTVTTADEKIAAVICSSYITGFLDSFVLIGEAPIKKLICLPDRGFTVDQAERVFLKFLTQNPEVLHEPGRGLLFQALGKAFPCKW